MLNAKLEHHLARPHALLHKISALIYIICTFRLAFTNDQCCIVICGCGINKRYVVWVTNWGKEINHVKRDFFLLYHLWYVYAFFTYAQVKYPLRFPLIIINILIFFWKEVLYLLKDIYMCVCVCVCVKGHVAKLAPPHTQSV